MKIYNAIERPQVTWTSIMLIILKENYLDLTDLELGNLIGTSKGAVRMKMHDLGLRRPKVKVERVKVGKVKVPKPKTSLQLERENKRIRAEEDRKKRDQLHKQAVTGRMTSKARTESQTKKIKQVDYSTKVMLRVDSKTFIYIDRDQDPKEARQRYLNTYPSRELTKERFI